MPIYRFRCPNCLEEEEILLPMTERNNARLHSCGAVMERLVSLPSLVIFPLTGRDKVLKTLNKEEGWSFPGGEKHRPRYEKAMATGLDQTRPVIGKGFG